MIGCWLILSTLVIWKNKYFALVLSSILGLISFYMLLAVLSAFKKFPSGDINGLQLLLVGASLFISLLVIAIYLPRKYLTLNKGV